MKTTVEDFSNVLVSEGRVIRRIKTLSQLIYLSNPTELDYLPLQLEKFFLMTLFNKYIVSGYDKEKLKPAFYWLESSKLKENALLVLVTDIHNSDNSTKRTTQLTQVSKNTEVRYNQYVSFLVQRGLL